MKKIGTFLLLILFNICSYSKNTTIDSLATISINAKEYKNGTILFNFSSKIRPSLILDSNGIGTISIPIKKPLFVSFEANDSIFFNLLLEPGYDIHYSINQGITKIGGTGSETNNYLLRAHVLLENVYNSYSKFYGKEGSSDDFINLMNSYSVKFNKFHKNFTDSFLLKKNIATILKTSIDVRLLAEKQKFVFSIGQKQIDSLHLEEKLGLINNDVFSDTLLFDTQYIDFLNFLIFNFEKTIGNKLFRKHPETNIYPILLFNEISKNNKYSEKIKEFLLYSNLAVELSENGINPTLENVCQVFYKIYPHSNYSDYLKKYFQKFKNLTTGSLAFDFHANTITDQTISLNEFRGKLTLIDVWATWCAPCKEEIPYVNKIQQNFKHRKFAVLYLSIDTDIKKWKTYVNKNKPLLDLKTNVITSDKDFKDFYKITTIPRYILIDENGLLIDAFCETPSKGNLENRIKEILNQHGL